MSRYNICRKHMIWVVCPECGGRFDEESVNSTNIESDDAGRDIVTFKCPNCKKTFKSLRLG
jgi:predicted RNA-binding Zn-ribbon protein involved in translation (DUF1610 family)